MFGPSTFTDTPRPLIKQIKVQLSVSNVCNKVHCISTNSRASQPDTATSAYFCVFCGTFLRNHVILISKKCCSKHLRITFIFTLFFVKILHLCLLKNIIIPQTFFKDFPQDFQSDFVTKYLSSRWLLHVWLKIIVNSMNGHRCIFMCKNSFAHSKKQVII